VSNVAGEVFTYSPLPPTMAHTGLRNWFRSPYRFEPYFCFTAGSKRVQVNQLQKEVVRLQMREQ
jgi:hypothetical protein